MEFCKVLCVYEWGESDQTWINKCKILDLDLCSDLFFKAEVIPEPLSKSAFSLDVVVCWVVTSYNMSHHIHAHPPPVYAVHIREASVRMCSVIQYPLSAYFFILCCNFTSSTAHLGFSFVSFRTEIHLHWDTGNEIAGH